MLPRPPVTDNLLQAAARCRHFARPLLWGVSLWSLVVALPYVYLYPGQSLSRPVCWVLALLAPLGMVVAASLARPHLILGVGLAGQLPILIACPELLGTRISGSIQGLAVAVLLLGFVVSAIDRSRASLDAEGKHRLKGLLPSPSSEAQVALIVLGVVWLAMAWWVDASDQQVVVERARTSRLAGAALCWIAVRTVSVSGRSFGLFAKRAVRLPGRSGRWQILLVRRIAWATLLGVALLWWST